ncbi:MAG: hypothetical protein KBB83_08595, partial [Alphaproteobacteria bacterium]|nr:hypothetical protein [Alphaproteobacteria bacterium]
MNGTVLIELLDSLKHETKNQIGFQASTLLYETDSILAVARQKLLDASSHVAMGQDILNEKLNIKITLKAVNKALSRINVLEQKQIYELYKSVSDLLAADYEAISLIEENKRLGDVAYMEQKSPPGYSIGETSDVNVKIGGYAGFKKDAGVADVKIKIGGSASLELQDSVRYSKSREGGLVYSNRITAGGGLEIEGGASFNLGKKIDLTDQGNLAGGKSLITAGVKGGLSAKVSVDLGIDTLAQVTERSAATKLDMSTGAKAGSNRFSDSVNRRVFDSEHAVRTSSDISLDAAMLNRRSVAIRRLEDKSLYPNIAAGYLDYSKKSYDVIDEGSNGLTWVGGTKSTKKTFSANLSGNARVVGAGILAGGVKSQMESVNERYVFQPKSIGSLANAALQGGVEGAQALILKFYDEQAPSNIMRYNEPIANALGFNSAKEYFKSINDSVRNESARFFDINSDSFIAVMNKRAEAYGNIRTLNDFFLSEDRQSRNFHQEEALAAARSLNREYGTKIPEEADALVGFPVRQSLTAPETFSEAQVGPGSYRITSPSNSYSKQYKSFLAVSSDIINAYEGLPAFLKVFSEPFRSARNPYLGYSINTPPADTRINYRDLANSVELARIRPPLNDMDVSTYGQFKKGYFNTGNNYSFYETQETYSGKFSALRPGLSNPTITTGVVDGALSPTNLNPVTAGSSTEVPLVSCEVSTSVQTYGPRTTNESLVGRRTTESIRTVMPTAPKTSGGVFRNILRFLGFNSNNISEIKSTSRLQITSGGREFLSDTIVSRYDNDLSKITIGGDFDLGTGGGVTLSAGLGAARSLPINANIMLGNDIGAVSSTYFKHIESISGGFKDLYESDSKSAARFILGAENDGFVKTMLFGDASYDHISAVLSKYRNAFINVGHEIELFPFHDSKGQARYRYTTEGEMINHSGLLGKIKRDNSPLFFATVEARKEAGRMLDPKYVDELLATDASQYGIKSDKSLQYYLKTASPEERFDFYKTPIGEELVASYLKAADFANELNFKITQNINYRTGYVDSYYDSGLYAPNDTIPVAQKAASSDYPLEINLDSNEPSVDSKPPLITVDNTLERMGSPAVASKANPLAGYVIDLGLDEPSVVPKPPLITADDTLERMGSMATVGETSENLNPLGVPRREFVP